MDPTDVKEDSVNLSASSSVSTVSVKSIANVTKEDGKLDLQKVRDWRIPKVKELHKSLQTNRVGGRNRAYQLRNTLPEASGSEMKPQAQSTPHVSRENTSELLQKVRSNMQTRPKRAKKDK